MVFLALILCGKYKQLRLLNLWHWFVLLSDLVVAGTLIYLVWFKVNERALVGVCELLAGIAWVFILREYGVLKWGGKISQDVAASPTKLPENQTGLEP